MAQQVIVDKGRGRVVGAVKPGNGLQDILSVSYEMFPLRSQPPVESWLGFLNPQGRASIGKRVRDGDPTLVDILGVNSLIRPYRGGPQDAGTLDVESELAGISAIALDHYLERFDNDDSSAMVHLGWFFSEIGNFYRRVADDFQRVLENGSAKEKEVYSEVNHRGLKQAALVCYVEAWRAFSSVPGHEGTADLIVQEFPPIAKFNLVRTHYQAMGEKVPKSVSPSLDKSANFYFEG